MVATSLGAPWIVEVMGATMTVCSNPITSWRAMMSAGRRLSGALNAYDQISLRGVN